MPRAAFYKMRFGFQPDCVDTKRLKSSYFNFASLFPSSYFRCKFLILLNYFIRTYCIISRAKRFLQIGLLALLFCLNNCDTIKREIL